MKEEMNKRYKKERRGKERMENGPERKAVCGFRLKTPRDGRLEYSSNI